jgi:hypothetical protein
VISCAVVVRLLLMQVLRTPELDKRVLILMSVAVCIGDTWKAERGKHGSRLC